MKWKDKSHQVFQTRVKNSSFGNPKFPLDPNSIYLIFCLFERACQDAGYDRALFFKILNFYVEENNDMFDVGKTLEK